MRRTGREEAERLWRLLQDDPTDVPAWRAIRPLLRAQGRSVGSLFQSVYLRATEAPRPPQSQQEANEQQSVMLENASWIVNCLDAFGWSFQLGTVEGKAHTFHHDVLIGSVSFPGRSPFNVRRTKKILIEMLHLRGACRVDYSITYNAQYPLPAEQITLGNLCLECLSKITDPDAPLLLSKKEQKELQDRKSAEQLRQLKAEQEQALRMSKEYRLEKKRKQEKEREAFLDKWHRENY